MKLTYPRESQCEGKKKFFSFVAAERALAGVMRHKGVGDKGAGDTRMHVYRCRHCAFFHLGHTRSVAPSTKKKLWEGRHA